jgi:hypothetical protein
MAQEWERRFAKGSALVKICYTLQGKPATWNAPVSEDEG